MSQHMSLWVGQRAGFRLGHQVLISPYAHPKTTKVFVFYCYMENMSTMDTIYPKEFFLTCGPVSLLSTCFAAYFLYGGYIAVTGGHRPTPTRGVPLRTFCNTNQTLHSKLHYALSSKYYHTFAHILSRNYPNIVQ